MQHSLVQLRVLHIRYFHKQSRCRRGRNHMVIGFTTTYACLSPLTL